MTHRASPQHLFTRSPHKRVTKAWSFSDTVVTRLVTPQVRNWSDAAITAYLGRSRPVPGAGEEGS